MNTWVLNSRRFLRLASACSRSSSGLVAINSSCRSLVVEAISIPPRAFASTLSLPPRRPRAMRPDPAIECGKTTHALRSAPDGGRARTRDARDMSLTYDIAAVAHELDRLVANPHIHK